MSIKSIKARQIFDSRGNPTVEVDLTTDKGTFRAAVPSGASTGKYEACELRDGGKDYVGKGVSKAIGNIRDTIAPKVIGKDPTKQQEIDKLMLDLDGTANKSKLGANAILAVSLAVCRAGAAQKGIPLYKHIAELAGNGDKEPLLPLPSFNVLNGGSHAGNALAMQEFMIMPTGAKSFKEAMKIGTEVYHALKGVIKKKYGIDAVNVGDEGGFAPNIQNNKDALVLISEAIKVSGHEGKVKIAMDSAASEFYKDGKYDMDFKNAKGGSDKDKLSGEELSKLYEEFCKEYPIVSIEDPFDEDDWDTFALMTKNIGKDVQIVGDDLLVTNPQRIKTGIEKKACNGLLLKVNQIGSVTESIDACNMARKEGWGVMVSHRSGETEDTFIADLVVGLRTGQIKTGAPCRSERLCKYNQLLRIEEEVGEKAQYAGSGFRNPK